MTKPEYIQLRSFPHNENVISLIYEYYKEKYEERKHKYFLKPNEFVQYFQVVHPNIKGIYENVSSYFDKAFNIRALYDKDNKLIAYL
jgi:hypothetical protein